MKTETKLLTLFIILAILWFGYLTYKVSFESGQDDTRRKAAAAGSGHYAINPLTGELVFYYHSNTNKP